MDRVIKENLKKKLDEEERQKDEKIKKELEKMQKQQKYEEFIKKTKIQN